MNATFLIELWAVTSAVIVAFFIARPQTSPRSTKLVIFSFTVSVSLFITDRVLWAATKKSLSDHATCLIVRNAPACLPEASDPATAQPVVDIQRPPESAEKNFKDARVAYEKSDFIKARFLAQQSCDLGHGNACTDVGAMWELGVGGKKSITAARSSHEKGCLLGHPKGCSNLGSMFEEGLGGLKDEVRARYWYKEACDMGYAKGCSFLARLYFVGVGGAKNDGVASFYFEKACSGGDASGCKKFGILSQLGSGTPKSLTLARISFQKACNGGDSEGCMLLQQDILKNVGQ